MKKTYEVFMNTSGNPSFGGRRFTVQAESEHDAIRIALSRHPDEKVASIKEK